jgi:3-phenylpropionate/trans-cinnamate dioxygenase ferredoxin subunit
MAQTKKPDREALSKKYVVARASDIAEGERIIVEVAGRSIGVFNIDGKFYAFLNRCPHRGAQLCKGDVLALLESDRPGEFKYDPTTKFLACPWHGWEFDIVTGQSWVSPDNMKARPFTIDVETSEVVADEIANGVAVQSGEDASQFVDPQMHRIKGPYQAEKVEASVEDDWVVLSLRRHPMQGGQQA